MSTNAHLTISGEKMKAYLPKLLAALPTEWRGTTFKNHNLLGRRQFAENMAELILKDSAITEADLVGLGNAEDYLRVASNVSTTLEFALSRDVTSAGTSDVDVDQVWSFASSRMPVLAVLFTSGETPVILYTGEKPALFSPAHAEILGILGCKLTQKSGPPEAHPDAIVLALQSAGGDADGIINDDSCQGNVLFIKNTAKIDPKEILIIRKRMSTPITTPVALSMLKQLAEGTMKAL